MVLFKDTSELKVISVGLLLGMVSCLHGLPVADFSLTVQGDKVILVYTGESPVFDADALPLFGGCDFLEQPLCVLEHTGVLPQSHEVSSVWSFSNPFTHNGLAEVLAVVSDYGTDIPTARQHLEFALAIYSCNNCPLFLCGRLQTTGQFVAASLLAYFATAHATRAGPIC